VDGHEACTGADDSLQIDLNLVVGLDPPFRCPDHSLVTVIGLADVVGQRHVLVGDLRIEVRENGLAVVRSTNAP